MDFMNLIIKTYYMYDDSNGKATSKELDIAIFDEDYNISTLINEYINNGYKLAYLSTKKCSAHFNLIKTNDNGFIIDTVEFDIFHDIKTNQWTNLNLQFFDQDKEDE